MRKSKFISPQLRSIFPCAIFLYIVSIGKHPIFAAFFLYALFPTFVQKICLHSTKQMLTVFVVLLLICVRESSAYVNSYVVMTSTLLTGCVYVFYNRPRNRIKLLHGERYGFVVYHKQMAQGCLSSKKSLCWT